MEQAEVAVRTIIELGKAKGFLTFDEINDLLPDEMSVPDKLEDILNALEELGIDIVDETADPEEEETASKEEKEKEKEKEEEEVLVIEPQARLYGRHRLRRDLAWEAMGTVLTTLGSGKKGNGVPLAVTLKRKKRYRRDGKGLKLVNRKTN